MAGSGRDRPRSGLNGVSIDQGTITFSEFLNGAMADAHMATRGRPLAPAEEPLLNGFPYRLFRRSIDVEERRAAGTFFSGSELAARLVMLLKPRLAKGSLVMDPTCGIGDLLLAYAAQLPLETTLYATLAAWGQQLAGMDLRPELVRMAKLRLVTLAKARGGFSDGAPDVDAAFPLITVGDMLREGPRLSAADGFLFNPPFGRTADHSIDGGWATGKVNAAAIFLAELVAARRPGSPIAAVLPEVVRCGSRYELFRRHLEEIGLGGESESLGRFDSWTDVDVFATLLAETDDATVWRGPVRHGIRDVVGDRFVIRVGTVVPHRHPHKGPWRRYICAKTVPAWTSGFEPQRSRRFQGTVFKPPFVVVRRTSSPSDRFRAVGALVTGSNEVAVENHLIVLVPIEGGADTCRDLLAVLKADRTSRYLNESIRCRHLTTGSVASIPWTADGD